MAQLLFSTEEEQKQIEELQQRIDLPKRPINEFGAGTAKSMEPLIECLKQARKELIELTDKMVKIQLMRPYPPTHSPERGG